MAFRKGLPSRSLLSPLLWAILSVQPGCPASVGAFRFPSLGLQHNACFVTSPTSSCPLEAIGGAEGHPFPRPPGGLVPRAPRHPLPGKGRGAGDRDRIQAWEGFSPPPRAGSADTDSSS